MGMVANGIQRVVRWFFKPRDPAARWWSTILWWEARRIPFSVIVGGVGIASLVVFFAAILSADVLGPGEDAAEPLALLAAPVLLNIAYTAGWVVEMPLRLVCPGLPRWFGPMLLGLGLGLTLMVEVLPAVMWAAVAMVKMVV